MVVKSEFTVEQRLKNMGLKLPKPAMPVANYVPSVISGNQLYISGQLPMIDGETHFVGRLGRDYEISDGQKAAELCALNIISQAKVALEGDLGRVRRVVKLGGFVCCTKDFSQEPQVVNGASDLMVALFGDKGRHTRFAVGVYTLPNRAAVEIDAIFEIDL